MINSKAGLLTMKAWFLDVSCQADLGGPKQNSQGKVEDRCRHLGRNEKRTTDGNFSEAAKKTHLVFVSGKKPANVTREQKKTKTFMWRFPKMEVPQNGWFVREHLTKTDDLGVPLF